jgi:hypothetical protein
VLILNIFKCLWQVSFKQKFNKSCNVIMEDHIEAKGTHATQIPSLTNCI